MSEDRPPEVLGALPHTRPHRRSSKRATRTSEPNGKLVAAKRAATGRLAAGNPAAASGKPTPLRKPKAAAKPKPKPKRLSQPAQPAGTPPRATAASRSSAQLRRQPAPASRQSPPSGSEIVGTAVQAAAELAEIGLTASARALRNALSRLPRP